MTTSTLPLDIWYRIAAEHMQAYYFVAVAIRGASELFNAPWNNSWRLDCMITFGVRIKLRGNTRNVLTIAHITCWALNGRSHSVFGPADICADGTRKWYQSGALHRVNAPAIIMDSHCDWYEDDYWMQRVQCATLSMHWPGEGLPFTVDPVTHQQLSAEIRAGDGGPAI